MLIRGSGRKFSPNCPGIHCGNYVDIDTGLCGGDLCKSVTLRTIMFSFPQALVVLMLRDAVADDTDLPIGGLQQPNLPDLESELHVQYVAIISKVEKCLLMMPNFHVAALSGC